MMKKSKLKEFDKGFSNIVFFSEGDNYFPTFKPLIDQLVSRGIKCSYISMSEDDKGLTLNNPLIKSYYIGPGIGSMVFMNMLEAGIVIMTTPGLNSLTIKRSPGVKKYVHIVHSPIDVLSYRKFSFDHFDYVMCSGQYQIDSLLKLEKIRDSKPKELLQTGCAYMDVLAKKAEGSTNIIDKCILIAPTWGPNSALARYGSGFVTNLADSGYSVIVRPHPQMLKSQKKLIKTLVKETSKNSNISWDFNPDGHPSLSSATILISDMSGVIFDFSFIYKKPVISLLYDIETKGSELEDCTDKNLWELGVRKQLGSLVDAQGISELNSTVQKQLEDDSFAKNIVELRDKSLFNFGSVGEVAVNQILEIEEKL
jgi:hypothetical protein